MVECNDYEVRYVSVGPSRQPAASPSASPTQTGCGRWHRPQRTGVPLRSTHTHKLMN